MSNIGINEVRVQRDASSQIPPPLIVADIQKSTISLMYEVWRDLLKIRYVVQAEKRVYRRRVKITKNSDDACMRK